MADTSTTPATPATSSGAAVFQTTVSKQRWNNAKWFAFGLIIGVAVKLTIKNKKIL